MELTEQDRSQIYLEMSKRAIRELVELRPAIRNYVGVNDVDVLAEWNRRFEQIAATFTQAMGAA